MALPRKLAQARHDARADRRGSDQADDALRAGEEPGQSDLQCWIVPANDWSATGPRWSTTSGRCSSTARAVLPRLAERDTPIGSWLRDLLARQQKNVVVVALANKLARICWAVLAGDRGFAEEVAEMH